MLRLFHLRVALAAKKCPKYYIASQSPPCESNNSCNSFFLRFHIMLDEYGILAEFLISDGDWVSQKHWLGNLNNLRFRYVSFCHKNGHPWKGDLDNFIKILEKFNKVSNNALELRRTFVSPGLELTFINKLKVQLVRDHIRGNKLEEKVIEVSPKEAISPQINLKQILGLIPLDPPKKLSLLVDGDAKLLWELLERRTAAEVLAAERARQVTVRKAFYHACDDSSHSQLLAKFCFGSKTFGQSMLDLPSNVKIRKTIATNRTQIPKSVYNCQKLKVHYLPLVTSSTDLTLGNCSYLDTCHKLKTCRYLHFYTLNPQQQENDKQPSEEAQLGLNYTIGEPGVILPETPAQWISCDVRKLPFSVLGKFAAIISDPAWDIHMALPYGTCKDAELLSLPMHELQDEGILFLWVTGRSIEIGRKALAQWGYTISD